MSTDGFWVETDPGTGAGRMNYEFWCVAYFKRSGDGLAVDPLCWCYTADRRPDAESVSIETSCGQWVAPGELCGFIMPLWLAKRRATCPECLALLDEPEADE
jgi:hypothetical protein